GKIALGASQQNVNTRGSTFISTTPATQVNAGFLALSTNSGRFARTDFAAIPEAGFNVCLNLTDHCKLIFGYSFVYWDNVMRPGDQVDHVVNPNRVPTSLTFGMPGGPNRPAPLLGGSDFWAQGFNFGLEIRY